MSTQDTEDHPGQSEADLELRTMLAQADPAAAHSLDTPHHLLDRIRTEIADQPVLSAPQRGSFLSRHWQGAVMAAAAVLSLALASATILPGLAGGGSDSSAGASSEVAAAPTAPAGAGGAADSGLAGADMALTDEAARNAAGSSSSAGGSTAADTGKNTLVRSASLLVGTEDLKAARDAFVADVLAKGGRVTSETVQTDGSGAQPYDAQATSDLGVSYPYPWYPSGPGIWLTVQVPADDYDATVEAARKLGEVVQLQQSSYDVGQQVTDVDARIQVLESSLQRLEALMEQADGVSEVIKVESAIAERQAELDSLLAQQRDLTNQTAMSQISLTLMTPDDAQQSVDPSPSQSWWESFLAGLSDLWAWLGRALLIVSPLLLGAGIIWWVRRRRGRAHASTATSASAAPAAAAAQPEAGADPGQ